MEQLEHQNREYVEDLLETSEAIYHKRITHYQMDQHTRKMEYQKQVGQWCVLQISAGQQEKAITHSGHFAILKFIEDLHRELQYVIRKEWEEKVYRDMSIREFGLENVQEKQIT